MYNYGMKIGIYGGTFDPIHNGHIAVANAVKREFGLDCVVFVVAADPPHKLNSNRTPGEIRLQMVQAAVDGEKGLVVSDIELKRGGISYTVDTLMEFHRLYEDAKLYFIVGADMLIDFPTWYKPAEILKLATLVAAGREGSRSHDELCAAAERIKEQFGGKVIVSLTNGPLISSTDIRQRVYDALPVNNLVPLKTELMIYERSLYVDDKLKEMHDKIAATIDEKRLQHTMYVEREAIVLADRYGVDTKKARLAALLHDCVKVPGAQIVELASKYGYELSGEEMMNPYIIHSGLGAVVARKEYGIEDEDVLNAIRRHTLGCENMTDLDKIVYLADKVEPSRKYRRVGTLRDLAMFDLDAGVIATMRHTINFTRSSGRAVHPLTLKVIETLQKASEKKKKQK